MEEPDAILKIGWIYLNWHYRPRWYDTQFVWTTSAARLQEMTPFFFEAKPKEKYWLWMD